MIQKALLLDTINQQATINFEAAGFEVVTFPKNITIPEFTEQAADVDVIGVRSGPAIPAEIIQAAPHLRAIGCYCVGTEHIDKVVAAENDVAVYNAPFDNGRSVAELVIGATFSVMRRLQEHNRALHAGNWTKTEQLSYELHGKTMGIVGYGNIGQQVGGMAEALGMNIAFADITRRTPNGRATQMRFNELLEVADVLTVHVPGGQNGPILNNDAFARMKQGAYVINTARAQAIDYDALAMALDTGIVAGAALDVFTNEPKKNGPGFVNQFQDDPRVLLTPHIGGSSQEAQISAANTVTAKLIEHCYEESFMANT